jgi:glycosyltransferase involved in cell wall biosynthesis/O-antigen ligase
VTGIVLRRHRPAAVAAGLLGGLLAVFSPLLAALTAMAAATFATLFALPSSALATLLLIASFLSGLAVKAGPLSIRPEQIAGVAVAIALLSRRSRAPIPRVALCAALWIGIGAVSGLFHPEPGRALEHTARLLATSVPLFALPALLASVEEAERTWDVFLALSVFACLIGLLALASHRLLETTWGVTAEKTLGFTHPHGTLLEPNLLGALSAAGALALLLRAFRRSSSSFTRGIAATGALVSLAALLVSVTRAAWLALPAAALGVALARRTGEPSPRSRQRWPLAAGLGLLILLAAVLLAVPLFEGFRDARTGIAGKIAVMAEPTADPNVAVRLRSYASALALFRESPLLGAGHGAMERNFGAEDRTLAWAGNLEIHLLADTGLAGLFVVLGLLAAVLAATLRRARTAGSVEARGRALERLGVLLVLFLCAQATETTWLASFWVVLGLLLAAAPRSAPARAGALRILYVHPSDELYGSDRVLLELVTRLDPARFTPLVLLSTDVQYPGRLSARLTAAGIPVTRLRIGVLRRRVLRTPLALARYLADVAVSTVRIARLIWRERIDLVHANTITVLPAAFAARLTGRPLVWHLHEIVDHRSGKGILLGLVRLLADRLVVVSEAARSALGRAGLSRILSVIPNGVPDRRPPWEPATPPVVAYVGRLSERKGPGLVVEAAGLLAARHPSARWVFEGDEFAGGSELLTSLKARVAVLGLSERVEFRSFREDVTDLYGEALIVVSPSVLPESFGLVLLEAMMAGRAVVASAHGGAKELVADGETGLLVPPGDAAALAAALSSLLDAPSRARAMGRAGRERALARFSLASAVPRFEALYTDLARARLCPS